MTRSPVSCSRAARSPLGPVMLGPVALGLAAAIAGCTSSPPAPATNPKILYLAPDAGETKVKLVDTEPPPF